MNMKSDFCSGRRQCPMKFRGLLFSATILFMALFLSDSLAEITSRGVTASPSIISVTEFLPKNYVKDGSVSYQKQLQRAIDAAVARKCNLLFPPMVYRVDETGLRVGSHLTLSMYGAVFQLDSLRRKDGQVFYGHDVTNVNFWGGTIIGQRDKWPSGVNIRGIHLTGKSKNIRIRDMTIRNLSSNGIGVFGDPRNPAEDIWVTDVVVENCCNYYGDYLSNRVGPEKGSTRKDQGSVAFYYVHDFVVKGCRFERSQSDGTHFYRCQRGQFVHNKVYDSQMGGYFIETCTQILASDNVIRNNGSRGVTIERGSQNCTLSDNIVEKSGREGLWAPDCIGLIVTGNLFDRNGRKPNGAKPNQIWNATITINEATHDPTHSPTRDYLIANNIIYSTESQIAAIRVDAAVSSGIVIKNNILRGGNRRILIENDDGQSVIVEGNE